MRKIIVFTALIFWPVCAWGQARIPLTVTILSVTETAIVGPPADTDIEVFFEIRNPGNVLMQSGSFHVLQSNLDTLDRSDVRAFLGNLSDIRHKRQREGPPGLTPNQLIGLEATR